MRLALERAEVQAADAVLIGDTPAHVAGAHAHGVRAVAVATGRSSERELREAGADLVLPDLCDTEAVVAAVHGWAG
ncbi:HAD family hydrolase [Streptomyces sp. BR1]|uniref:HAD family hydrolase n=1 Tax=Streptomyces sp. BR1 TaxID=1592323 RepID=UPI00402B0BAC